MPVNLNYSMHQLSITMKIDISITSNDYIYRLRYLSNLYCYNYSTLLHKKAKGSQFKTGTYN